MAKKTARVKLTKMPVTLRENPVKLFLLRRWARILQLQFDGAVYLFGSTARGSTNPRDCDIAVVVSDKQFAERYATPCMLKKMSHRDIVTQWMAEERGTEPSGRLWDRWVTEVRKVQKQGYHKYTGLVIDLTVRPRSDWRGITNIQFWRLA